MPLLKLHFPEEIVNPENFEDVLLQINKTIPDSSLKFKSREAWMRALLREYAVASMTSFRGWETTRYISTQKGPLHIPELDFWEGDVESLDDEEEGAPVFITIGKLQHGFLKTAVKWENTYQKEILKSGIEHKSVAALSRHIILTALLQAQAKVDEETMKEEEREILEEEGKENSEKDKNL